MFFLESSVLTVVAIRRDLSPLTVIQEVHFTLRIFRPFRRPFRHSLWIQE